MQFAAGLRRAHRGPVGAAAHARRVDVGVAQQLGQLPDRLQALGIARAVAHLVVLGDGDQPVLVDDARLAQQFRAPGRMFVDRLALLGRQRRHLSRQPGLQVDHRDVHRQGRLERAPLLAGAPSQVARRRLAGGRRVDRVGHAVVARTRAGFVPAHDLRQREVRRLGDQGEQPVGALVDRPGHVGRLRGQREPHVGVALVPLGGQIAGAARARLLGSRLDGPGQLVDLDQGAALEELLQLRLVDDHLPAREQQHARRVAHAERQRRAEHDAILDRRE